METNTPSLEEVKEYFKNAKEVKFCNSNTIGLLSTYNFNYNDSGGINEFSNDGDCLKTRTYFHCIWANGKYAEIISYKEELETPKHYDNSKGSIYQFCENKNLNSYEFEVIKRITRCRKKGEFLSDIKKTIQVLEIYLQEQGEKFKGENEILNK